MPHGSELRVVSVEEVSYLRADHKYTTIVMKEKLDPQLFWQIHRSVIVNARGALEIKLKERQESLPVSAAHAHLFREMR